MGLDLRDQDFPAGNRRTIDRHDWQIPCLTSFPCDASGRSSRATGPTAMHASAASTDATPSTAVAASAGGSRSRQRLSAKRRMANKCGLLISISSVGGSTRRPARLEYEITVLVCSSLVDLWRTQGGKDRRALGGASVVR